MSKISLILALLLAVMTVSCQSNDVTDDTQNSESGVTDNISAEESSDDKETEAEESEPSSAETEQRSEETEADETESQSEESESVESEETDAIANTGEFTADDLYFTPAGTDIKLSPDDDFAPSADTLGTPLSFNEAPSCNYDGNDKVYEYDGYTVYTYPADGTDKILIVELFGDNCATSKGVSIGMSVAEMEASYGTGYVQNGFLYEYSCDDGVLCFTAEGNTISLIEFVSYN